MMRRLFAILTTMALAACATTAPPPSQQTLRITLEAETVWLEDDVLKIDHQFAGDRYEFSDASSLGLANNLAREAEDAGAIITLDIVTGGASLDPETWRFIYPICRIWLGDRVAEDKAACNAGVVTPKGTHQRLFLANALTSAGSWPDARQQLGHIDAALLETPALERFWGLKVELLESRIYELGDGHAERDQAIVDAIRALRDAAAIMPSNNGFPAKEAELLTELGAYNEADAIYRRLIAGDLRDRTLHIARAASKRAAGDLAGSLRILDRMHNIDPDDNDMRLRYHRAWTYMMLGRHRDAVVDLSRGLIDQPAYTWAQVRRACAYLQLENAEAARADVQRALSQLRSELPDLTEPNDDMMRLVELIDGLAEERAPYDWAALIDTCTGFDNFFPLPRERSPLLAELFD